MAEQVQGHHFCLVTLEGHRVRSARDVWVGALPALPGSQERVWVELHSSELVRSDEEGGLSFYRASVDRWEHAPLAQAGAAPGSAGG